MRPFLKHLPAKRLVTIATLVTLYRNQFLYSLFRFVLLQEKENVNDVQTDHCFDNNFTGECEPSKSSHKRPLKSTSNNNADSDKATFAYTSPPKKLCTNIQHNSIELMS